MKQGPWSCSLKEPCYANNLKTTRSRYILSLKMKFISTHILIMNFLGTKQRSKSHTPPPWASGVQHYGTELSYCVGELFPEYIPHFSPVHSNIFECSSHQYKMAWLFPWNLNTSSNMLWVMCNSNTNKTETICK